MHLQLIFLISLFSLTLAANDPACGTKGPLPPHLSGHHRVIDGTDARPHEFPWQCSLQKGNFSFPNPALPVVFEHVCGASILNDRWLLTAAHCVAASDNTTHPADLYRVVCGAHDFAKPSSTEVNASIAELFLHPQFYFNLTIEYDFALIKLKERLPLNNASRHLATICLPESSDPLDHLAGTKCIATGWGVSSRNPRTSKTILQKATFTVMKQAQCVKKWGPGKPQSIVKPQPIKDCHICIENGEKSVCQGDSGGPLNCWVNGKWYNYGVVSFLDLDSTNFDCVASGTTPNVYGRATAAVKWIWPTIDSHS